MKNTSPKILVVTRHRDAEASEAIHEALARQTYTNTRLVLVHEADDQHIFSDDNSDFCPEGKLVAHVRKSGAAMVLFWPEEGGLRETAIEKLAIALQLAPDQQGVADSAQASTGLWLARVDETTLSLIGTWLVSQSEWLGECLKWKAQFFHIPEDLMAPSDEEIRRPYAIGHLFDKLRLNLKNFAPISTGPLWSMDDTTPDDKSVLFLVNSLPMGGACKFILDIAGQLKAQGYRVTVATTTYDSYNPNPWLGELLRIIPDVFILSHARPTDLPRQIVHLARARRFSRVVLSHSMLAYQLLPYLRSELPEVAFLDYTHIEYENAWPDGGFALRSIHNQPMLDLAMVSSHHLREWMLERGANEDLVSVCYTNIDTEKWKPSSEVRARVRYELGIDKKTAVILYPCRLADQKRPELLCNIVAGLRRATRTPFVVVVAGDGPLMTPLNNFVEKERLEDCVRLLGAVSLERVAQLHNAADIFLLPSLIEGIALALFEAMALESVPVVSDVGGQRELVTPDCGELIPLGDIARELTAYVAALQHLLENPDQRRKMATACRTRVTEHYSIGQMTVNFIAALDAAGARHAAKPAPIPHPLICREIATLAIDQIRVALENFVKVEAICLFEEKMEKQDKIVQRLQRQIVALRSSQPVREENELPC
jgi:glycosyltransferase involved in cell wall biosynthesis